MTHFNPTMENVTMESVTMEKDSVPFHFDLPSPVGCLPKLSLLTFLV